MTSCTSTAKILWQRTRRRQLRAAGIYSRIKRLLLRGFDERTLCYVSRVGQRGQAHVTASPSGGQARQPIERRLDKAQAESLGDVLGEQRFTVNRDIARRQRGHLPTVNAGDIPLRGDASAP